MRELQLLQVRRNADGAVRYGTVQCSAAAPRNHFPVALDAATHALPDPPVSWPAFRAAQSERSERSSYR